MNYFVADAAIFLFASLASVVGFGFILKEMGSGMPLALLPFLTVGACVFGLVAVHLNRAERNRVGVQGE